MEGKTVYRDRKEIPARIAVMIQNTLLTSLAGQMAAACAHPTAPSESDFQEAEAPVAAETLPTPI